MLYFRTKHEYDCRRIISSEARKWIGEAPSRAISSVTLKTRCLEDFPRRVCKRVDRVANRCPDDPTVARGQRPGRE